MKNKEYDCVKMKHKAAERIHERLKGLSIAEKMSYWDARHKEMVKRKSGQEKTGEK